MPLKMKQSGFSLLEAVVVVAIIAILAAWAAPSMLDLRNRIALRSAGEDFITSLAEAKMAASKENRNVVVDFNATAARFPPRISLVEDSTIGTGSDTPGQVTIEPRMGILTDPTDTGTFELQADDYRLRFFISPVGQGLICFPDTGENPGVPAC